MIGHGHLRICILVVSICVALLALQGCDGEPEEPEPICLDMTGLWDTTVQTWSVIDIIQDAGGCTYTGRYAELDSDSKKPVKALSVRGKVFPDGEIIAIHSGTPIKTGVFVTVTRNTIDWTDGTTWTRVLSSRASNANASLITPELQGTPALPTAPGGSENSTEP